MSALVWITGLSGSGKTTLAKEVVAQLRQKSISVIHLDGDEFREAMGNDTGHTAKCRLENAYRIAKMCHLLIKQNVTVVCSTMSLYKEIHELNRSIVNKYIEIFVECEIEELERRDQKGLYSGVKSGNKFNVVGLDLPFDRPEIPDIVLNNTNKDDLEKNAKKIFDHLKEKLALS